MGEDRTPVGLVGFVEVPGFQDGTDYETWKEITLNTGASQSTLQDIKFPETAGGYVYKESNVVGSALSNRFIHWRSHDSTLELVESSLDLQLKGGLLRLQFHHSAVLSGLSIYETPQHVLILLATVSSVYRLTFPHPKKMARSKELSLGLGSGWCFSIFHEASLASLWDSQNSYVLNSTGASVPSPHTATTGLNSNGDALFVLALNTGTLQVVCMPSKGSGEKISLWEIRHMSVMSRLWSGLVPSVMWASQEGEDMAISLALCSLPNLSGSDPCVVALCKDLRIRLWSLTKRECLLAASLMEYCKNQHSWNLSGQQPCLQLVPRSQNGALDVAVHLCFPELSQFLIFRIDADENDAAALKVLASMAAPEHSLVDFKFTLTDMWTLWMDVNSDPLVLYTPYNWETGQMECTNWRILSFHPTWPQEVPSTLVDAREVYLKEIFAPGRFSASTINKAISIYCRSSGETSFRSDFSQKNFLQLKDRVTMAVENEIRNRACETELTDEAYLELQNACWEQFLSYCIQYHEVGIKVLGLLVDPGTDLIGIIRKHWVSLCRPCDPLEVILLSDMSQCSPSLVMEHLSDSTDSSFINPTNCKGLWSIMKNIQKLHECTGLESTQDFFDHGLFYLRSPEDLVTEIADELIFSAGGPLLADLGEGLNDVSHVLDCLQSLLQQLDLAKYEEDMNCFNQQSQDHSCKQSFFGSPSGVNNVYLSLLQMAKFRYYFCRDLAILESVIIYWAEKKMVNMNYDQLQQLRSKLFSQTCCFMHSYFVMYWALQTLAVPVKQKTLETGLRELSIVDFPEHSHSITSSKSDGNPQTLVQLFIQRHGSNIASQALQSSFVADQPGPWTHMWNTYRTLLAATIWPIATSMTFTEFLLTSGQYLSLQEYVRLTEGWCERNSSSRLFLLANAYLSLCQPLKALTLFFEAAKGIHSEPFLMEKFIGSSSSEVIAGYYLEVIQLFEYFNLPDCIIRVANEAITSCTDSTNLATFWSLIFKYHLDLDRCSDAYSAMMRNPDVTRRRDCLHQFLIVLFERGHQRQLIKFPFDGLVDDVILILESKARSTDLLSHSYYEFLYAFHVKCANYRRAASNMYEYSTRLGQEVIGLKGLSGQAACLLTTINCLSLVDPYYAWIVKPVPTISQDDEPVSMSPKRDYDGQEIENPGKWRQIQVLELCDIAREYDLVHARMTLLKRSVDHIAGPLSPTDTVTLLVAEDLFPLAVKLCQSYNLSLQPVFDGLASRCANEILVNSEISKDQLWKMLQDYLLEHESPGFSTYHRLVSEKLLAAGLHLPTWLHKSYKARNAPELLFIYLGNDFLSEASDLALEIIDDALFQGKQIADSKKINLWLPYTILDKLLTILDENTTNYNFKQMHDVVSKKINEYFDIVESWASV